MYNSDQNINRNETKDSRLVIVILRGHKKEKNILVFLESQ